MIRRKVCFPFDIVMVEPERSALPPKIEGTIFTIWFIAFPLDARVEIPFHN